jgi:hypothetical protein
MQKFCNRIIIALHLYNRQPKKFGIIHTPSMQPKKRSHLHPVENTCFTTGDRVASCRDAIYRVFLSRLLMAFCYHLLLSPLQKPIIYTNNR